MKKIFVLITGLGTLLFTNTNAQKSETEQDIAKIKPFSLSVLGITFTGTYSDGCASTHEVNGTSILWGAISWGGSTQITCTPGCSYCRVTAVFSLGRMSIVTNDAGEKCFEKVNTPDAITPVFVGVKDGAITFAIDIDQTVEHQKSYYSRSVFELNSPLILEPGVVRNLNLYSGLDEVGYVIPPGKYPLFRDGKIYYWTFVPPAK